MTILNTIIKFIPLEKKVKRKDTNKIYNSLSSVEEDGFIWQLVRKCCIGKQKKHKGVEWEYVDTLSR